MGHLPWTQFDEIFNLKLEVALDKWDPGKDGYGRGRWEKIRGAVVPGELPHSGELALDAPAIAVVQLEYAEIPKLVEPNQGFDSLDEVLWPLYTIGRNMGLFDLGTYNPDSKLPSSGKPSDHATCRLDGRIMQPAAAFDLGFFPRNGFSNPKAQAFYYLMAERPGVHYVICGNRIWSAELGHHDYNDGGHEGHVHTSGYRH